VGRAQPLDQCIPGFMLQLFEAGSADANRQVFGLGLQVARTFNPNVEHDLAHGGISFVPPSSLVWWRDRAGAVGYLLFPDPSLG
jgi:hypothetical protein